MLLDCIARAVTIEHERTSRYRQRKLERARIAEETAALRERRQHVKPNPLMVALHQRLETSGVSPSVAEAFKALPDNEQRRYEEAAGDDFAEGLPIYLDLKPDERSRGLVACKTIRPFTLALRACRSRFEAH